MKLEELPPFLQTTVLTIVDIGAREGLPPQWLPFAGNLRAIMVEPDPEEAERLKRQAEQSGLKEAHVIPTALSDKKGTLSLHLANTGANSSVLRPNMAFLSRFPDVDRFKTAKKVDIPCDTLDGQLAMLGIESVDFIKLDVEGYEGQVLAGGTKALGSCLGLASEVSFAERYIGDTHFNVVDRLARDTGLVLADLERKWWRRGVAPRETFGIGQMVFADCIWLTDPVASQCLSREQLLKIVLIMLVYSFYDWSYESMAFGVERGLTTEDEKQVLREWIAKRSLYGQPLHRFIAGLPAFPFKRSLARFFGLLSQHLGGNLYGEHFQSDGTAWNRKWRWLQ